MDCVLRRNTLRIKQVYRVPFVRNSDSQTVMLWLCASKSYTFPQLIASYQHWHITVLYCNPIQCYSFSRLLTHIFWKHASFSQNSKHKSLNHSHKMQQHSQHCVGLFLIAHCQYCLELEQDAVVFCPFLFYIFLSFFCWLYWPISYCLFCANHLHIHLCLLWCIGYSTFGKNKEIF